MEDLENDYKELKKKNKALKHHLKEEAAMVQKQQSEIAELKVNLANKLERVEEM